MHNDLILYYFFAYVLFLALSWLTPNQAATSDRRLAEHPLNASHAATSLRLWLISGGIHGPNFGKDSDVHFQLTRVLEFFEGCKDAKGGPSLVKSAESILQELGMPDDDPKSFKAHQIDKFLKTSNAAIEAYAQASGLLKIPSMVVYGAKGGNKTKKQKEAGDRTSIRFEIKWVEFTQIEEAFGNGEQSIAEDETQSTTIYLLDDQHIGDNLDGHLPVEHSPAAMRGDASGRYIVYSVDLATKTWIGRLLFPKDRMPTSSWQWRIYRWYVLVLVLFFLLVACLISVMIFNGKGLGANQVVGLLLLGVGGLFLSWNLTFVPFARLIDDRINIASEYWAGGGESSQVELVRTGDGEVDVQFVRYSAMCLVCGSKVEVVDGKSEFHHRLIGRCRESPREHVFSFDRVTRTGFPIRRGSM